MGKIIDLTGRRFGRITVLERCEYNNSNNKVMWRCLCDCGNERNLAGSELKRGNIKSCGCLHEENMSAGLYFKHGASGGGKAPTRLYRIWKNMRQRCSNPNRRDHASYYDKGICVCEEWNDFLAFEDWAMTHGYDDSLSIDRIDCNGDYCPGNCRWATNKTQQNNMSSNRIVEFRGSFYTVSELSQVSIQYGVDLINLRARIYRGWDVEKAVTEPVCMKYSHPSTKPIAAQENT